MASIRERRYKGGETAWAVLYRHGGRQTSLTFDSRKAAEKFRALVEAFGPERAVEMHRGEHPETRFTVNELADAYLERRAAAVTERTITDYRRDIGNWVRPWFGHRSADAITESDVQRWVDHMAARLSPKSVADRHALLFAMFKFGKAKSRQLVAHNPCEETELPRRVKRPPKGTTPAEFRAILDAARRVKANGDAADLILFLGETGCRFSEATALGVRDVDDDGTHVWVRIGRVFRLNKSGRQILTEDAVKSEAGFRRFRLLPDSAAMVRRRLVGKGPGDLVLTNRLGNPWNQHTFLRDTWPAIRDAAELEPGRRPTPHWLRHMHVYVMHAAGADLAEIQKRIGHEHISTTIDTYGRMIGDVDDAALEAAGSILSNRRAVVAGEVVRELPSG